jgi:RNA polymerase sigma-32 factor
MAKKKQIKTPVPKPKASRSVKRASAPEVIENKKSQAQKTKPQTPEILDVSNENDDIVTIESLSNLSPDEFAHQNDRAIALLNESGTAISKNETGLLPADPVSRYMAQIRKYPLLTKEDEFALAVRYKETGDPEAAQRLITSNLRFVVKIAAEYSKFGNKMIDLIQEGNIGLMQAVKDFNPYKGVRLITYAVWWIRGYIQDFLLRHYSMVRIGTTHTQRKLFYELQRSRDQLERMGMEAGLMQISGRLGIPEDEVKQMSERVLNRDVSLDKPVGGDDSSTLMDLTASTTGNTTESDLSNFEEIELLKKNVAEIQSQFSERERFMLEKRILSEEPLTLQEVGDRYGITREAARQMEAKLIDKIRKKMLSSLGED